MDQAAGHEGRWRAGLAGRAAAGRLRALRPLDRLGGGRVRVAGRELADFASNDYLGLSHHPYLVERARDFAARYGVGAGASRLVAGELSPMAVIEDRLAAEKGAEAALLMASGFQANASLPAALADGRRPLILADRLIHASLIQGCLAAGAPPVRFRHNDLTHLAALLERHADDPRPKLILTETVFGMDGDRPDLSALTALARSHGALLYLDEAHATGLFGARGFGLACGLAAADCVVMGTFGKALGGFGAYVAGTSAMREHLVNRCAGLVYATALPPPVLGAIEAAIELVPSLDAERRLVQERAARFRAAAAALGLDTGASTTQIVPLILGAEARALAAALLLEDQGILAVAIRPPTVPAGTSRLRLAFGAVQREEDVERLIALLPRLAALPA